jgi:hypothetical protein
VNAVQKLENPQPGGRMYKKSIWAGMAFSALVAGVAAAPSAWAQNIVQNHSFEDDGTGISGLHTPVSDWTITGSRIGETSNFYTFLAMGTTGSAGHASQVLNTVVGQQYVFGFNFTSDGSPATFTASWANGNNPASPITVFSTVNSPSNPAWDTSSTPNGHSFVLTATSTTTVIDFAARTAGGFVALDDVQVYAIPLSDPALPGVLYGLQGGSAANPVSLSGGPTSEIVGDIGGAVPDSFYRFYWNGGAFDATTSLVGADASSSFAFELLGDTNHSSVLNQDDGFIGRINLDDLAAGYYSIGLSTGGAPDPTYYINFATPVQGAVPEPATWAMMLAGFVTVGATLRSNRRRAFRTT